MVFDRSEADEVRKTAFEAWPCRDTEIDLKGEALLARARSRGGGAAAGAQMVLLLYRRAEIEEARAATGKLGPEARDFLIAESADPVRVLRERAIALLGGFGGDPVVFAALQKLASDRAVPTELRADALESLAAVDAARAVPIAEQPAPSAS